MIARDPNGEPHTVVRVLLTITANPQGADDIEPTEALIAYAIAGSANSIAQEIEHQMESDFSSHATIGVHGQIVDAVETTTTVDTDIPHTLDNIAKVLEQRLEGGPPLPIPDMLRTVARKVREWDEYEAEDGDA